MMRKAGSTPHDHPKVETIYCNMAKLKSFHFFPHIYLFMFILLEAKGRALIINAYNSSFYHEYYFVLDKL